MRFSADAINCCGIWELNNISDPDKVFAGTKLIIPDDSSSDTYTILYILNQKRLSKEKDKITAGGTSLYADPVTAAQSDIKNVYNLGADTPWSKTNEVGATITVSTSDKDRIVTATLEKVEDGFWLVKKLIIKVTQTNT